MADEDAVDDISYGCDSPKSFLTISECDETNDVVDISDADSEPSLSDVSSAEMNNEDKNDEELSLSSLSSTELDEDLCDNSKTEHCSSSLKRPADSSFAFDDAKKMRLIDNNMNANGVPGDRRDKNVCLECGQMGHSVKFCPKLICSKCGVQGHFASECDRIKAAIAKVEATSQKREPPKPQNLTTIPLGFQVNNLSPISSVSSGIASQNSTPFDPSIPPPPCIPSMAEDDGSEETSSILSFFKYKLKAIKKDECHATKYTDTWLKIGHDELSLRQLVETKEPDSAASLRLILVQEIVRVSSSDIPREVDLQELLEFTVAFLWNKDLSREKQVPSQRVVQQSVTGFKSSFS